MKGKAVLDRLGERTDEEGHVVASCRSFSRLAILALSLLAGDLAFGAQYYVRADGTAADKTGATNCGSSATAMNVGTYHGQAFSAA